MAVFPHCRLGLPVSAPKRTCFEGRRSFSQARSLQDPGFPGKEVAVPSNKTRTELSFHEAALRKRRTLKRVR
jgi:hypothetical protein